MSQPRPPSRTGTSPRPSSRGMPLSPPVRSGIGCVGSRGLFRVTFGVPGDSDRSQGPHTRRASAGGAVLPEGRGGGDSCGQFGKQPDPRQQWEGRCALGLARTGNAAHRSEGGHVTATRLGADDRGRRVALSSKGHRTMQGLWGQRWGVQESELEVRGSEPARVRQSENDWRGPRTVLVPGDRGQGHACVLRPRAWRLGSAEPAFPHEV